MIKIPKAEGYFFKNSLNKKINNINNKNKNDINDKDNKNDMNDKNDINDKNDKNDINDKDDDNDDNNDEIRVEYIKKIGKIDTKLEIKKEDFEIMIEKNNEEVGNIMYVTNEIMSKELNYDVLFGDLKNIEINKYIILDFHGVVYCPNENINITIRHLIDILNLAINLRIKGIGIIILSFVGKLGNSHANLLSFFSSNILFQNIFCGLFVTYQKPRMWKIAPFGKAYVIQWLIKFLNQSKILFVDDDPTNIYDVVTQINKDNCSVIKFADPILTDKKPTGNNLSPVAHSFPDLKSILLSFHN